MQVTIQSREIYLRAFADRTEFPGYGAIFDVGSGARFGGLASPGGACSGSENARITLSNRPSPAGWVGREARLFGALRQRQSDRALPLSGLETNELTADDDRDRCEDCEAPPAGRTEPF
jgi:hypothetical protein